MDAKDNSLLLGAYSADAFRAEAPKIMKLIGDELELLQMDDSQKTIERRTPQEQLSFWRADLDSMASCGLSDLAEKIMERSIHFHVCFRFVPDDGDINETNIRIADELLKDGTFYTVSTVIRGQFYLRVTLMNPLTGAEELTRLLQKVREAAADVIREAEMITKNKK